jgi:hypothetical protein
LWWALVGGAGKLPFHGEYRDQIVQILLDMNISNRGLGQGIVDQMRHGPGVASREPIWVVFSSSICAICRTSTRSKAGLVQRIAERPLVVIKEMGRWNYRVKPVTGYFCKHAADIMNLHHQQPTRSQ